MAMNLTVTVIPEQNGEVHANVEVLQDLCMKSAYENGSKEKRAMPMPMPEDGLEKICNTEMSSASLC